MPTSQADSRGKPAHLEVSGVDAGYADVPIIRNVSLCVAQGEVATVIGPNGAGKSTLLKAVMGILCPIRGDIRLGGASISGLTSDQVARRGVGYVPQVRDVFDSLSVKENLEMGGYQLRRRQVPPRIEEVLDAFPPLAQMMNRSAAHLSGGERKMVAIGRVLMTRPSLVILDEPTAGLSPKLAHQMLVDYVSRLTTRGVAVLLVEQRAREALEIADFAYVMASGEVKLALPAADVLQRPNLGKVFLGEGIEVVA